MRVIVVFALLAFASAIPVDNSLQASSSIDIKCTLCEEIVQVAEKQLQRNGTEDSIKNAINNVCQVIEKHIPVASELCQALDDNVDEIIQLLVQELSPEEVCKLISLCANTNPVVQAPPKLKDNCATCQTIVQLVESELKQNATEQGIAKVVTSACSVLEKYVPQVKLECDFVINNLPTIIGLITSEVNPQEVCSLIGQCSKGRQTLPVSKPVTKPVAAHLPFDNCDTCKELVSLVESELEQNATETEINQLIGEACSFIEQYVPQVQAECQMIQDNIADIIAYLVNQVSPEEACTLAGMCQGKAVPAIIKAVKAKHLL